MHTTTAFVTIPAAREFDASVDGVDDEVACTELSELHPVASNNKATMPSVAIGAILRRFIIQRY